MWMTFIHEIGNAKTQKKPIRIHVVVFTYKMANP